jgi:glycine cleavage system protein P-like pyridoxal-binding family
MKNLEGDNTHLNIDGGYGSPNGGGGGSGGRMVVNYLASYLKSSYPK